MSKIQSLKIEREIFAQGYVEAAMNMDELGMEYWANEVALIDKQIDELLEKVAKVIGES